MRGRETIASCVLMAFCLKDAEFRSQLFLSFIRVKSMQCKKRSLPTSMHWNQILLHGLCVSCSCTLFPLFPAPFTQNFQKSSHLHSQLFWHTREHSHTCRSTVSLLGCPLVLREGHAGRSPLRVKKGMSGCAESLEVL